MLKFVLVAAATTAPSTGVHGPEGLVANAPVGDDEVSSTAMGEGASWGTPASWSWTAIGVDGMPAVSVSGGVVKLAPGGVHDLNPLHPPLNALPATSATHQMLTPVGAQAPLPGSPGSALSTESRTAAA